MNYFTGIATSPTFEFPYSGYPINSISHLDSDINAILAVRRIHFDQLNENKIVFDRILHRHQVLKFTISLHQLLCNVFLK